MLNDVSGAPGESQQRAGRLAAPFRTCVHLCVLGTRSFFCASRPRRLACDASHPCPHPCPCQSRALQEALAQQQAAEKAVASAGLEATLARLRKGMWQGGGRVGGAAAGSRATTAGADADDEGGSAARRGAGVDSSAVPPQLPATARD